MLDQITDHQEFSNSNDLTSSYDAATQTLKGFVINTDTERDINFQVEIVVQGNFVNYLPLGQFTVKLRCWDNQLIITPPIMQTTYNIYRSQEDNFWFDITFPEFTTNSNI